MTASINYNILIPARLQSSRLERKLLRRVGGQSIVEHTWRRASLSQAQRIVIATDAEEIAAEAEQFGAEYLVTDANLSCGTDRVYAAAHKLGLASDEIIVNVQADEPLIDPHLIDNLAEFFAGRADDAMATIACPESNPGAGADTSIVKVVCDSNQRALYFSRADIPWHGDADTRLTHVGIYAYKLEYLHRFVSYPPCALELSENLEQLRALWHGDNIAVLVRSTAQHIGIDTQDDLARFERYWSQHHSH